MNLLTLDATAQLDLLKKKSISSFELTQKTIDHILAGDPAINAVVVRDFDQALATAKHCDALRATSKDCPPLLGLPMTIKESFNIKGMPTCWGDPKFKNWQPDFNCLLVERLKDAGAIIIGKTNVPVWLRDYQSYNLVYGQTNNPINPAYTPGGSSGGSAAAVAAGFSSLELGSDLAGSIRLPASFCGIYGHKSSVHLLPLRGATPPLAPALPVPITDLVAAGPLARSAQDLALMVKLLAGPDPLWEGAGYQLNLPQSQKTDLNDFRVLLLTSHPSCPTDAKVQTAITQFGQQLQEQGITVADSHPLLPNLSDIAELYSQLAGSFVGSNLTAEEYQKMLQLKSRPAMQDDPFLKGLASNFRSWSHAKQYQNALRQQWRKLYDHFDVILCPTFSTTAFKHDYYMQSRQTILINQKTYPVRSTFGWPSIASLFGLPATVAPIAKTKNGLPIGIQIIGDYLCDYTTIEFATLIQKHNLY